VEYPFAEVLDRYTILCLKEHFGVDVEEELNEFEAVVAEHFGEVWPMVRPTIALATCNALQWVLEGQVGEGHSAADIACAALQIRRSNVERVAAKNAVARLTDGSVDKRIMYPGAEKNE